MPELTGDMVAGAGIVLEVRWLDAWMEDKSRDTGHMNRRVRVGFFNYPAQRVAVLEYSTSLVIIQTGLFHLCILHEFWYRAYIYNPSSRPIL